nr:hypothetical protein [Bacilli bacterium]
MKRITKATIISMMITATLFSPMTSAFAATLPNTPSAFVHVSGVSTMKTMSSSVQVMLQQIQNRQPSTGSIGDPTTSQFQSYMLKMETRLDMLKKLMDDVSQAVRSFHK